MKQYQKPEMKMRIFESADIIMVSNTAYDDIMKQLTDDFGVDAAAIDSAKYENWGA